MPKAYNVASLLILLLTCGIEVSTSQDGSILGIFQENLLKVPKDFAEVSEKVSEDLKRGVQEYFNFTNISFTTPPNGITDKCCGRYGCFTAKQPFGLSRCRPLSVLPVCQDILQIRFYLWTRENKENKDVIDPETHSTLTSSHFRNTICIFIFINGYLGSGDMFFVRDMKDAVLAKKDCMFISVEWVIGARMDYLTSSANVQMVSAVTAYMVQQMMDIYKIGPQNFHIVGYSLGAHAAGGVGKRIPGIARITGVDPAGFLFQPCDTTIRLSKTDAAFVDVLHVDSTFFGSILPAGHLDIAVNGGYSQPACFGLQGCSHLLAIFYFIDTISATCPYYAYQCDDQDNFERGKCSTGCGDDGSLCAPMGYRADQWKGNSTMSPTFMFTKIGATKSFCMYHYYVTINCTDDKVRLWRYGRNQDKLYINLKGSDGETGFQQANENSVRFTSFPNITTLIAFEHQIGKINSIVLKVVPNGIVLGSTGNCQNLNITEPTSTCCVETFDANEGRCLMCPYIVKSIYAKNLETSNSASFEGRNEPLKPNEETAFNSV